MGLDTAGFFSDGLIRFSPCSISVSANKVAFPDDATNTWGLPLKLLLLVPLSTATTVELEAAEGSGTTRRNLAAVAAAAAAAASTSPPPRATAKTATTKGKPQASAAAATSRTPAAPPPPAAPATATPSTTGPPPPPTTALTWTTMRTPAAAAAAAVPSTSPPPRATTKTAKAEATTRPEGEAAEAAVDAGVAALEGQEEQEPEEQEPEEQEPEEQEEEEEEKERIFSSTAAESKEACQGPPARGGIKAEREEERRLGAPRRRIKKEALLGWQPFGEVGYRHRRAKKSLKKHAGDIDSHHFRQGSREPPAEGLRRRAHCTRKGDEIRGRSPEKGSTYELVTTETGDDVVKQGEVVRNFKSPGRS
eukprot:g12712.t1